MCLQDRTEALGTDTGYFHKPYSLCTPKTPAFLYSEESAGIGVAPTTPKHVGSKDSTLQSALTSLRKKV